MASAITLSASAQRCIQDFRSVLRSTHVAIGYDERIHVRKGSAPVRIFMSHKLTSTCAHAWVMGAQTKRTFYVADGTGNVFKAPHSIILQHLHEPTDLSDHLDKVSHVCGADYRAGFSFRNVKVDKFEIDMGDDSTMWIYIAHPAYERVSDCGSISSSFTASTGSSSPQMCSSHDDDAKHVDIEKVFHQLDELHSMSNMNIKAFRTRYGI